jgi:thymidylate synthase ThyX
MTISAKMILDSVSPNRIRLRTMQLRYPKFIHAELMTHRAFSRNASSSRAIPVNRLIQDVIDDTAMPLKWFSNKTGMQGGEEIVGADREFLVTEWNDARDYAVRKARRMTAANAHKQHVNRVLDPFSHINVLVTSTDWANWDALRDHDAAQPEIRELAKQIKLASEASTPMLLQPGHWHLPYVTPEDWIEATEKNGDDLIEPHQVKTLIKLSVARCARVSYMTQDGKPPQFHQDLQLYDRLIGSEPLHASPAEHQATPDIYEKGTEGPRASWHPDHWANPTWHGNFRGWIQFRKTLRGESVLDLPFVCSPSTVSADLSSEAS